MFELKRKKALDSNDQKKILSFLKIEKYTFQSTRNGNVIERIIK